VRALVLLLIAGVAHADRLDEIRARGKLIASVKNQGPSAPELHKDPAHFQKRGFEIAIAHAIAEKVLGDPAKLELKLLPKASRVAAVASGVVDLAITMLAVTDDRKAQVDFSRPYWVGGLTLLVRKGSPIAGLAELDGKRVVVAQQNANDHGAELVRMAGKIKLTLERAKSFAEGAAAVEAGKYDALVAPEANIDVWLRTHPKLARTPRLRDERYAVAVRKGETRLLAAVDEAIAALEKSGTLARLAAENGL